MGFSLKKFFKKVIKTAVGVGLTAVTGGALSSAAGFGRGLGKGLFGGGGAGLGSKIGRNLSNLAKRAGGFLKSLFTRKANTPAQGGGGGLESVTGSRSRVGGNPLDNQVI